MYHIHLLKTHYRNLFGLLLRNAAETEAGWDNLVTRLSRLNLTDVVTPAPRFSKFPWLRHPLALKRHLFRTSDDAHLFLVATALADNWVQLLERDSDDLCVNILLRQNHNSLLTVLHRVAVNTATARTIAGLAVLDAVTDAPGFNQLFAGLFSHESRS